MILIFFFNSCFNIAQIDYDLIVSEIQGSVSRNNGIKLSLKKNNKKEAERERSTSINLSILLFKGFPCLDSSFF